MNEQKIRLSFGNHSLHWGINAPLKTPPPLSCQAPPPPLNLQTVQAPLLAINPPYILAFRELPVPLNLGFFSEPQKY